MIKIKEYPPVISIMTIIEDRLLGAKSYPTVVKRLGVLKVKILQFDMVRTEELFSALLPEEVPTHEVSMRKDEPFKLRKS